jgi:adrenodoxin-NADP+ reductase
LSQLKNHYDAILFAYGASKDRELGIPGEHLNGIYSARAFVGWYNGLPEYADLEPDLQSGDTAVVIGQGNVALDVARVLLSGIDRLRSTDIAIHALDRLSKSSIKRVHIVGRRGPLQAAFTIKELRELISLPQVNFQPVAAELLPGTEIKLPRAPKRITDLLRKHSSANPDQASPNPKSVSLDFLSSPVAFHSSSASPDKLSSVLLARNTFQKDEDPFSPNAQVRSTSDQYSRDASVAFRSIGYKSEPLPGMEDLGIQFDMRTGTIPNLGGRVLRGNTHISGLYCAGWVKRGPTGVIATTMEDGFATAELIAEDWQGKATGKRGWEDLKNQLPRAISWDDWLKIDAFERELGRSSGKQREKLRNVDQMLSIVG